MVVVLLLLRAIVIVVAVELVGGIATGGGCGWIRIAAPSRGAFIAVSW